MAQHDGAKKLSFREIRPEPNPGKPKSQWSIILFLIAKFMYIDDQLQFHPIQNSGDVKDRTARRLTRSQAVSQGLEKKRKLQEELGHNFRAVTFKDGLGPPTSKRRQNQTLVTPTCALSAGVPGPLQMLAAESPRLQGLLSRCKIFASVQNYPGKAYMEWFRQCPTGYAAVL
jgi:hypothetical protein